MQMPISRYRRTLRYLAATGAISLLAACSQTSGPAGITSNAPSPSANWYHIAFSTNSHVIDKQGALTVADLTGYMQKHPDSIATIIGKTDTVGSASYNMHLSHLRADAVRDALVYHSNVAADRVETRWTGEAGQTVVTGNGVAAESNRVVDIALH